MGARRYLPQRSERKPTGFLGNDGPGVFAVSVESQPIFGVLGGRPQLKAALFESVTAPFDQLDHPVPITGRTEAVDEPYERIEVTGGDGCGKVGHEAGA